MSQIEIPSKPLFCANFSQGRWDEGVRGSKLPVTSPYTGEVVGEVPLSTSEDVARVVAAARNAAESWGRTPIKERTEILFRLREKILSRCDALAELAALEAGKTVAEAKAGVLKGVEVLEYALGVQNLDDGGALEVSRGVTCEVRREPLGVVAGITPFNFPAMVPLWMIPIALVCGNAFIHKPSEKVPLTACRLGELIEESGFPPGVFSIVHGDRVAVEAIIDHDDVQAVAFVGSSAVARQVYARAAAGGKRVLALGGAKNHLIVVPDADPSVTTQGVVDSFTGCAGQRCMAASLMIAVGEVDELIDRIVERASRIRLGEDMGALIDGAAKERLVAAIARAREDGAAVRLDGTSSEAPKGYENGNWLGATILDHAQSDWDCVTRELFGPILSIVRVDTLEEALALENKSPYGNATSVFTTSGAVARRVADHASNGMIGVNIGVPVPREPFSFGGTKSSRFGNGDITGRGGVDFWTQLKKITTKWERTGDTNWMS